MKSRLANYLMLSALSVAASVNAAALANTVYFSADGGAGGSGSVEAVMPLEKLGSVEVPRGAIIIRGDIAELSSVPEWQFDRHKILTGTVLDTRVTGSTITGVAFFDRGEWLKYFDRPGASDEVITGGRRVTGRIEAVQNGVVMVRTSSGMQNINLTDVTAIRSPRAFNFTMPVTGMIPAPQGTPSRANAKSIAVRPTTTPYHLTALKAEVKRELDDGDLSTARLIAIGATVNMIQLGQLLPYIVIPSTSSHLAHQMKMRQLGALVNASR